MPRFEASRARFTGERSECGGGAEKVPHFPPQKTRGHRIQRDATPTVRRFTERAARAAYTRFSVRKALDHWQSESFTQRRIHAKTATGVGLIQGGIADRTIVVQRASRSLKRVDPSQCG